MQGEATRRADRPWSPARAKAWRIGHGVFRQPKMPCLTVADRWLTAALAMFRGVTAMVLGVFHARTRHSGESARLGLWESSAQIRLWSGVFCLAPSPVLAHATDPTTSEPQSPTAAAILFSTINLCVPHGRNRPQGQTGDPRLMEPPGLQRPIVVLHRNARVSKRPPFSV